GETVAAREVLLDPTIGWILDEMFDAEQVRVDLLARLHHVAAVDEQQRAIHQHDRRAGRAGEAGKPGEPLLAGRDVFVLVAVRAWHDEAGQVATRQFRAQCREPRRARRAVGAILERLETRFEHGGNVHRVSSPRKRDAY